MINDVKTALNYTSEEEFFIEEAKEPSFDLVRRGIKRGFDIMAGTIGCILLFPLTLIVFFLNKKNGEKGPVFFVQKRIGKDGKPFKMYKYRTMIINAEEVLDNFLMKNPSLKEEYETNKKLKDDPRITKVGAFLRKSSLDEFPQFINVLKGEMSLVGPRPYLPREKKDMGRCYDYITKCKPGITGLWQISGRSDLSFKERLRLDMEYYNNHSLIGDINIILRTITVTILKKGAI